MTSVENNHAFFKVSEVQNEQFLKFPELLTNPKSKYYNLRNDAKIAYMVMKDRMKLSLMNGNQWFDKETGRVFIYMPLTTLAEKTNTSVRTCQRIKKELIAAGLISEKQQGFNKPNKIYVHQLDQELVTEPIDKDPICENFSNKTSSNTDESRTGQSGQSGVANLASLDWSDLPPNQSEFNHDDDDVFINAQEKKNFELLQQQFENDMGVKPTQVQVNRLRELTQHHNSLTVSEAITRTALNGSSSLLYVERVVETLEQEYSKLVNEKLQRNNPHSSNPRRDMLNKRMDNSEGGAR